MPDDLLHSVPSGMVAYFRCTSAKP